MTWTLIGAMVACLGGVFLGVFTCRWLIDRMDSVFLLWEKWGEHSPWSSNF